MSQIPQAQEASSHMADNFNTSFETTRFLRDTSLQRAAFPMTERWNHP
jgi:hypothetical protein